MLSLLVFFTPPPPPRALGGGAIEKYASTFLSLSLSRAQNTQKIVFCVSCVSELFKIKPRAIIASREKKEEKDKASARESVLRLRFCSREGSANVCGYDDDDDDDDDFGAVSGFYLLAPAENADDDDEEEQQEQRDETNDTKPSGGGTENERFLR